MRKTITPTPFLLLVGLLFVAFSSFAQSTASGTVIGADGKPVAGATVQQKGAAKATTTDSDGKFSFSLDASKPARLVISGVGYLSLETGAGNGISVSLQQDDRNTLGDVAVVGSRANRSALSTAVPVDVISFKNITQTSPQVDLNQILTYLAPSFQSNRQSASDGSEHVDPATLRGLGPDQLLVLVNGKRRHNSSLLNYQGTVGNGSAGTDLNAIPAAAIERIEVLRDGAAAQYGSDAIAGVINVVLKKNYTGTLLNAGAGITSRGDGENWNLNLNQGLALGKKGGYINLTGDVLYRQQTDRSQNHDLVIYDQSAIGNFFAYPFTDDPARSRAYDDSVIAARRLNRDDFNFRVGDAGIRSGAFFYNLSLPVGRHELYSFGGASYRRGEGNGFRRLPSETSNVVLELFPNGFQPATISNIIDRSMGVGFKFNFAKDFTVDLSNTFGNNVFDYIVENTNNATLRKNSPTTFNAGGHSFTQNTLNLDARKRFANVAKGLNIAFGGEFRTDKYGINNGEEASWRNYAYSADGSTIINPSLLDYAGGSQSFVGFSPRNALKKSRTNVSGYADFELDVTKNLLITAAVRAEDYSDFGSTVNGKLATRIQVLPTLALRGAVSTGFRAPSLHQQFFSYTSTDILPNGKLGQAGFFPNNSSVAKGLGIPELKQETSFNASAGITFNPVQNLRITVDGYMINIDDRIVLTGSFGFDPFGDPVDDIQQILEPYGVSSARFFSNAVNTRTKGIDVVASYLWKTGKHSFDFSLAGNYNENKVDKVNVPEGLESQADIFFSPAERSIIETYAPRTKASFGVTHRWAKLSSMLRVTYFGEVTRNGYPFGSLQKHAGKTVTDISVNYAFTSKISATIGANNLFDVFPDKQVYENSYFGVFPYAPVQMGFTGANYFARVSLKF